MDPVNLTDPPAARSRDRQDVAPRTVLSDGRWAVRTTWSTAPGLTALLVAAELGKSLVAVGLTVVLGGLVGAAAAPARSPRAVLLWVGAALVLSVVAGLSKLGERYAARRLVDELGVRLTSAILEQAARLDVATFEDPASLDLLERARRDPALELHQFLQQAVRVAGDLLQVAALTAILVAVEPWLALPVALLAGPYAAFQLRGAVRQYGHERARTTRSRWSEYCVRLLTRPPAVLEVRLLDLVPLLVGRFRDVAAGFRDESARLARRSAVAGAAFVVLSSAALFAVVAHLALEVVAGRASVGRLVVFAGAAARLRAALEETLSFLGAALERALAVSSLRAFLALEPRAKTGRRTLPDGAPAEVELDGVTFTYPGAQAPALSDVTLRIRPGETVALVGENGAGKTTLVRLLARIHDPDRGSVRLSGVDLRELDPADLRRRIAWVLQDFTRFEATAAENIAFGDWRRLLGDRAAVERIARETGAAPLVEGMPDGYDTWLGTLFGQQGLSTGQWQRIAIARAFARPAPLLLLDEPAASLDVRAEEELFRRFRQLAAGRTALVVSHRFSTVAMADRIVVLSAGRVAEVGTHDELLARGGLYAELYRLGERTRGRPAAT